MQGQQPIRLAQECRDGIGQVNHGENDQNALHRPVGPTHHHSPHQRRTQRHHQIFSHSEDGHARGQSGKLGHDVGEIRRPQNHHGEKCGAKAEFLANQIRQAFAGDRAHARRHLLDHHQGDGGGDQRPQQGVTELGPRLRVGEDAARVVINVGGDEAGAEDGEKHQQAQPQGGECRPSGSAPAKQSAPQISL